MDQTQILKSAIEFLKPNLLQTALKSTICKTLTPREIHDVFIYAVKRKKIDISNDNHSSPVILQMLLDRGYGDTNEIFSEA